MGKYKIIYADPPWSYRNKKTGGSMKSGSVNKYPTLSLEEICNLNIKDLAHKDSVLFLWITVPLLPDGLKVMQNWGFQYKTALFWRKIMSLGMGFWFRGQIEILLMGIRGKVRAFRMQKANVIQAKVGKHSEKPIEFRRLIEDIGLIPRIELFASEKYKGWDSIGYDIDGMDITASIRELLMEKIK